MDNANLKLSIVRDNDINPENVYAVINQLASDSSKMCEQAKGYWEFMQNQHNSIAQLMEAAEALRVKKKEHGLTEDENEELNSILETAVEIVESINRVRNGKSIADDAMDIDSLTSQLELQEDSIDETKWASTKFMSAYLKHKNRLGLKTQDQVAEITGLDRRYISNIERAKYKPQFKTIKRIADAFGVDVHEFM